MSLPDQSTGILNRFHDLANELEHHQGAAKLDYNALAADLYKKAIRELANAVRHFNEALQAESLLPKP